MTDSCTTLMRVKTRPLHPPQDDLYEALDPALPQLKEGDVVVVTSKVLAIHQGRCVEIAAVRDKEELIEREAECWVPRALSPSGLSLTIKEGTFVGNAGIDSSNSDGHFILWPTAPSETAAAIGRRLKGIHNISNLGVIVADSHCTPLRRGTTGISIGSYGFEGLRDYRGQPDIFGRPLEVTLSNRVDAMAAAAASLMGEGAECVPVVVIRGWPDLIFNDAVGQPNLLVPANEDVFAPLLEGFRSYARAGLTGSVGR